MSRGKKAETVKIVMAGAKAAKTSKKKRVAKPIRPPYRIAIGRVPASGKGYGFERHEYRELDAVMAAAQSAVDADDGRLHQVNIIIDQKALSRMSAKAETN